MWRDALDLLGWHIAHEELTRLCTEGDEYQKNGYRELVIKMAFDPESLGQVEAATVLPPMEDGVQSGCCGQVLPG